MLKVEKLVVGQMQTNCYLLYEDKTRQAYLIDPGDDPDYIAGKVKDLELKPKAILATHGHFDHVLGVNELKLAFNLPFYISKKDKFLLKKMRASCKKFLGFDPGPQPAADKYLEDVDKLKVGGRTIEKFNTPGHTPGSFTFYSKKRQIALIGDVLFALGGLGRTDFSYSDEKLLGESVKKILALPKHTLILSGHGGKTTVEHENIIQKKADLSA